MALDETQTKPDFANPVDTDLDAIRDRFAWMLVVMAANGNVALPGWTSTAYSTSSPQDFSKPDYWLLTDDGDAREIRFDLTYSGDNVSTIVIKYNPGTTSPGMATINDGTVTINRDGDGNVTSITTA